MTPSFESSNAYICRDPELDQVDQVHVIAHLTDALRQKLLEYHYFVFIEVKRAEVHNIAYCLIIFVAFFYVIVVDTQIFVCQQKQKTF